MRRTQPALATTLTCLALLTGCAVSNEVDERADGDATPETSAVTDDRGDDGAGTEDTGQESLEEVLDTPSTPEEAVREWLMALEEGKAMTACGMSTPEMMPALIDEAAAKGLIARTLACPDAVDGFSTYIRDRGGLGTMTVTVKTANEQTAQVHVDVQAGVRDQTYRLDHDALEGWRIATAPTLD